MYVWTDSVEHPSILRQESVRWMRPLILISAEGSDLLCIAGRAIAGPKSLRQERTLGDACAVDSVSRTRYWYKIAKSQAWLPTGLLPRLARTCQEICLREARRKHYLAAGQEEEQTSSECPELQDIRMLSSSVRTAGMLARRKSIGSCGCCRPCRPYALVFARFRLGCRAPGRRHAALSSSLPSACPLQPRNCIPGPAGYKRRSR